MFFNCYETQVRPGPGGGGRFYLSPLIEVPSWADPEGETGKSQNIWVSVGNKQLAIGHDPPPLEEIGPPWKMFDPLWNLEKG